MDTESQPLSGADVPLEVLVRWDPTSETVYTLKEATAEVGALGIEYPARAVDPGGVIRDMRVVVLSPLEASNLRGRIHDRLVALGALRNPIIGAAEATVVVDDGFALVVPVTQGKTLEHLLEGGPIPARAAAEVALELAWGLAASHAAVLPDQIRPMAIPHGRIDSYNVTVSGLGEVVLTEYNVHAARSDGATKADDIYALGGLFMHLVMGDPLPAPPADPDAARQMIAEDLDGIGGITDELRTLMMEMLDPEPGRRPEVRSVARRLRQVIPQQDGLWLSAWAESVIGLPARQAPQFVMPTPTMVTEDFSPDDLDEEDDPSAQKPSVEANRKLVKVGRKRQGGVQVRFPARVVATVAFAALLVMGGGFKLARFWIDKHGLLDMFDGLAEGDEGGGASAGRGGASSGPRAPGAKGKAGSQADPNQVIEATAAAPDDAGDEAVASDLLEPDEAAPSEDEVADEDAATDDAEGSDGTEEDAGTATDPVEAGVADEEASARDEEAAEDDGDAGNDAETTTDAATTAAVEVTEADVELAEETPDGIDAVLETASPPDAVAEVMPPTDEPMPMVGPPPWPRPAGTLGEFDLFVEVPLAESVQLRCTNGLSMEGPSRFRAAIMQSSGTRCVVTAGLRDGSNATVAVQLDRTLDLICRYNYHETLRCADRPTSWNPSLPIPSEDELRKPRSDIRVRVPLALSAEISCEGGKQTSGVDIEWLELNQVSVGTCTVKSSMPDGVYGGSFVVNKNAEILCLRDFAGPIGEDNRRPLRCASTTVL